MAPVRVDIWSDVACPWCYVGKRHFDAALSRFEHGDEVDVRWRSFELDPSAPAVGEGAYVDRLAAKYRVSVAEAQAMIDRMTEAGARAGIVLRFDKARRGNTFDAHRLSHLAAARGVQHEVEERLFHAMFTAGAALTDVDVLVALGEDAGIDSDEARAALATDAFAAEVRADEVQAAELGITSVPYFVVDGTYGVAGAQPPEVLLPVLDDAWAESHTQAPSS